MSLVAEVILLPGVRRFRAAFIVAEAASTVSDAPPGRTMRNGKFRWLAPRVG